jgi:hypothetical protein
MPFTINGTTGINLGTQPLTGSLPDANAPSGSVIQVVSSTLSTQPVNITSTSYVDTGLSVSITPISSTSKILVLVQNNAAHYQGTSSARRFSCNLLRGATSIATTECSSNGTVASNGFFESVLNFDFMYLDSPATTSPTTYKTQAKVNDSASSTTIQINSASGPASITLMEITA